MFYLPQALIAWAAAIYLIEWRRSRQLLLYALLASYLALAQDHIGSWFNLWRYIDTFPFDSHEKISMLHSLSSAPLFSMYFVQGLKPGGSYPWLRIVLITGFALIPEALALMTGNIAYGPGWNLGYSMLVYLLLWTGYWLLFRWETSPGSLRPNQAE